ncbi:hypothetical protein AB0878_24210 [Amycolatopsis sp. NPDC047767]|uniref:hypothetical protein n=1 Tax=Amycolatopsis sp. NPDC047767 TaxID=3156765 RepID=UPI0034560B0B
MPNVFGGATACDATKEHYGSVTLTLDPGQKYTDNINNPSTATSGRINGRPAMLARARRLARAVRNRVAGQP